MIFLCPAVVCVYVQTMCIHVVVSLLSFWLAKTVFVNLLKFFLGC